MQATIFISREAMTTANAIKDLDYHTRVSLADEASTDLSNQPGYYLKNADKINLAELPTTAHVPLRLHITEQCQATFEISMPTNLRGCIFEHAPNLPDGYADIITYWSGKPLNADDYRAVFFQNPQNEYLVELRGALDGEEYTSTDRLLSEGIVASIKGIAVMIKSLASEDFIEVEIPIDASMVGIENDGFRSSSPYTPSETGRYQHIYLKVSDIQRSPDPDHIMIDLLRYELLDYGYWY